MKISTLLIALFLGILIYAGIERSTGITGVTQKNGDGCICHNFNPTSSVFVRIEGPSSLSRGQTAQYTIKLSGGPAVQGGFNVAALLGDLTVSGSGVREESGELTHTAPPTFIDTVISWTFNFTALDSVYTDTLYSVGNSVNGDGIPSDLDQWNFGAKFPITVEDIVPVELTSFSASVVSEGVNLKWATSSETNNKGFYVERANQSNSSEWETLQFINGAGSTTQTKTYSYTDHSPLAGVSYYRLKQIDYDGSFTHSSILKVSNVSVIESFVLSQNYPNPFNPSTMISYSIPHNSFVTLKVYDVVGNEVATLVNQNQQAGKYDVRFDASDLSNGVYLYQIKTNEFTSTKKMILMK